MKKLLLLLVVVFALFIFVATVGAQGGLTYDTGFQVQNLDTTATANIIISYYNKDGTPNVPPVPDTIQPGKSNTYFPIDANAGFDGSAVISSDTSVAAISNVLANGVAFGASYDGFSQGASGISLPLIMKQNGGFSTWYNVQNADLTNDATVTVSYAGTPCTETKTIKPGAAATFDQATNSCLSSGYVGAADVDAGTGTIVATVMEVGPTTLFAYNGFTGGSQDPVIPLVNANNAGFITGIQIQNTGSNPSNVTVSYTPIPGGGTACTETQTIPANTSRTFALNAFSLAPASSSSTCGFGSTFVGSAKVTANSASVDLVGIANQLNLGTNKGSSYNAFDPSQATDQVVLPLIMDRNSGFYTGFNIQNVGSGATVVTCNFASNDGSVTSSVSSPTLNPGDAFNHLQQNALASGFVGSALCNATGGAPIIGVVNELGSGSGDQLFTYEGFNN